MDGFKDDRIAHLESQVEELRNLADRLTRENEALRRANDALKKENEKLRGEVRKGHRQSGRFSKDRKKQNPKKPGRKPGHPPASRDTPNPDQINETVPVPLCSCPECGGGLEDVRTDELYQTDIPRAPEPIVTKFEVESGFCPRCKRRVRARHPRQRSEPNSVVRSVLGPNLLALLALLKDGYGMPFRRISEFLHRFWQIDVTPGGISQALDRVADRLRGTYEVIITELRASVIAHVDETGWRINGDTAWLWVFTNGKLTVYTIRKSRGADVLDDVLGEDFHGVLASDCLNTYASYPADWKSKCLGHLLKDLREVQDTKTGMAARFAGSAIAICRDAISMKNMKLTMPEEVYEAACHEIIDRMIHLVRGDYSDPDNIRLAHRIEKHLVEYFLFLEVDDLDPTNNQAERQLRPAVITRKISCGSRTANGAERHSIIASVLTTAKQLGRDFCLMVVEALLSFGEPVLAHDDFPVDAPLPWTRAPAPEG